MKRKIGILLAFGKRIKIQTFQAIPLEKPEKNQFSKLKMAFSFEDFRAAPGTFSMLLPNNPVGKTQQMLR